MSWGLGAGPTHYLLNAMIFSCSLATFLGCACGIDCSRKSNFFITSSCLLSEVLLSAGTAITHEDGLARACHWLLKVVFTPFSSSLDERSHIFCIRAIRTLSSLGIRATDVEEEKVGQRRRRKASSNPGAGPEQTALSLDPWGQAAALFQQVQGSIRPQGRIRVEVAVETDPARLPGFRGHRKPWVPFWGLNGFFSQRKQMLALFADLVVSLHPPRPFLLSSPRLSLRQAAVRAQASRISGACSSTQTKCAERPWGPKEEKGLSLSRCRLSSAPRVLELLRLTLLQKQVHALHFSAVFNNYVGD